MSEPSIEEVKSTSTKDIKVITNGNKDENDNNDDRKVSSWSTREVAGRSLSQMSNFLNEHLVAVRYGTLASVALLAAYGVSKTPLFFRYRIVSDIPSSMFVSRRTIHGRIVHVVESDVTATNATAATKGEQPIICLVRTLSPIGRLLNRPAFDLLMKYSPASPHVTTTLGIDTAAAAAANKGDISKLSRDLLKVQIAGVKAPSFYYAAQGAEQQGEWLRRLAANRTLVSCTLLCKTIPYSANSNHDASPNGHKGDVSVSHLLRPLNGTLDDSERHEIAVCHMKYRPGMTIFRKDLGASLVQFGRAGVALGMAHDSISSLSSTSSSAAAAVTVTPTALVVEGTTSTQLKHLRDDVRYLELLGKYEFDAVKQSLGMWSDPSVRQERPDLVEEAHFEANAGFLRKLWRRIRHGS